jgi:hypothetical protein
MFEEPDNPDEQPTERSASPSAAAREKSDELRMHAELAAVFEGNRKFEARILAGVDPQIARQVQQSMGRLEKAKSPESPVLPESSIAAAAELLDLPKASGLSTNDYHIHRRPGEVVIMRWLAGEQVETFYQRLQAHFDAALDGLREDERQAHEWKKDPGTLAWLAALDAVQVKMADRYLRPLILARKIFVLSTQAADEMNIQHLCDYIMGVPAAQIVGSVSAPPADPTQRDLAWFFKLFSLRGMKEQTEQMCFFAYLQKSDDFLAD